MNGRPKITIIMPVYNMAHYLEQSISSWMNQTLQEIELICIDDASTDQSFQILESWEQKNPKVHVCGFQKNMSAWTARKTGVQMARGEFIMFADADDTVQPDTCETLYEEMRRDPADILHFRSEVVNVNHLPDTEIYSLARFLEPYKGQLRGKDILTTCFRDGKYGFTLWNKIFSASLCKKALNTQPDMYLPKGQDKLTYFILAYYADSYRGFYGKRFYRYYFGRGGFGYQDITLEKFESFCTMAKVSDCLDGFLDSISARQEYAQIADRFRKELLNNCISKWNDSVHFENKNNAFDLLFKYWNKEELISAFSASFCNDRYELAKQLQGAEVLKYTRSSVKTIATYYHSIENGGLARVLCSLCKLWLQMGYRVILITDSYPSKKDYDLPEQVNRFIVPDYLKSSGCNYEERARVLNKILVENNVDAVVYHAWVSPLILWDELVVKSSGAAFIIHCHGVFSYALLNPSARFREFIAPYILADSVITLSEVDETFWLHFNNSVYTIINPFPADWQEWKRSKCDSHDILWVGRLSDEKRPYDALEILSDVLARVPDAKLHIVGESKKEGYEKAFRKRIRNLHLVKAVVLHGFHKNVEKFYEKASLFLFTSKYEGYSMALQEALLAGLPIVMYELPYLVLTKGNKGILSVPQGNVSDAAGAVINLLIDKEKRLGQAEASREYIDNLTDYNFVSVWKRIFDDVGAAHENDCSKEETLMMETMLQHMDTGYLAMKDIREKHNRKVVRAALTAAEVKDSLTEKGLMETTKGAVRKIRAYVLN